MAALPPLTCNLELSLQDLESGDKMASLSNQNFALPYLVCAVSTILAILLHICSNDKDRSSNDAATDENSFKDNYDDHDEGESRNTRDSHIVSLASTSSAKQRCNDDIFPNDIILETPVDLADLEMDLIQVGTNHPGYHHQHAGEGAHVTQNCHHKVGSPIYHYCDEDPAIMRQTMKELLASQQKMLRFLEEIQPTAVMRKRKINRHDQASC